MKERRRDKGCFNSTNSTLDVSGRIHPHSFIFGKRAGANHLPHHWESGSGFFGHQVFFWLEFPQKPDEWVTRQVQPMKPFSLGREPWISIQPPNTHSGSVYGGGGGKGGGRSGLLPGSYLTWPLLPPLASPFALLSHVEFFLLAVLHFHFESALFKFVAPPPSLSPLCHLCGHRADHVWSPRRGQNTGV